MDYWGTVFIMFLLVVFSAFFSATETAFSCMSVTKLKLMSEHGNKSAEKALRLYSDYNKLISTVLVGNNIVNIALASMGAVFFVDLLGSSGATVSTAVITVVVLIFGEITPKSLAKESPESFAMFSAPLIGALEIVLIPINFLFSLWKKFISHIVKSKEDRSLTEEELLTIVEEVEQNGGIGEQEGMLIRSALEFNEKSAADIATPRVDVVAVKKDSLGREVDKIFEETEYSRLPVYNESIDDIIGIIHLSDFSRLAKKGSPLPEEAIKKAVFVPTTVKIGALLKQMQREKCHMAVVTDEYGGTYGIVTMEDILEELVGEIWDEHDEETEDFTEEATGVYTVSGSADPEEMFEYLGMDRDTRYATVSGWVMDELDKVPEVGDSFCCEGCTVTVKTVDGMRAETVEINRNEEK